MSFLQLFSHSSFLYLLCFLFVILVDIQLSLSNPCLKPFTCGSVTAQYPFWGGDRPPSCGLGPLRLRCEEDGSTAIMMMEDVKYSVLNVDYARNVLMIKRHDRGGVCPPDHLDTLINIFDNSSTEYEKLTLSFSCSLFHRPGICFPDDAINESGFVHEKDEYDSQCSIRFNFLVPKNFTGEAKQNLSNLEQVLIGGFEVKWVYCQNPPTPGCIPPKPSEKSSNKGRNIIIATVAGVLGIIVVLSILLMSGLRQKLKLFRENDQNMEAFVRNYGTLAPKRYNYSDVKKMTKSFRNKLGQGGFGDVYKGKLPDGRLVAVKVLKASKGNGEEFVNEVASISRTSHVNVVAFLGFCYERKKRALIYEFMPNGSLDKFIYDQESSTMNRKLEWGTMYQIAVGIARGLEYLHRGCNIRIVHFDIKPHNILLDEDFCPKISDFGLSKQPKKKESIISMLDARGTAGYIAPEVFCRSFGAVSHKSDVYSYGMMILEMVGGRKNINARVSHTSDIYFPDSIYKRLEPGKDFELHGVVTEEEKAIAKKMTLVSLWCIQTVPSHRPSMTEVADMLEGSLENIEIPPKPSLSSPTRSPKFSSQTTSSPILASCEESSKS